MMVRKSGLEDQVSLSSFLKSQREIRVRGHNRYLSVPRSDIIYMPMRAIGDVIFEEKDILTHSDIAGI